MAKQRVEINQKTVAGFDQLYPDTTLINNLTTTQAGRGALDASQGKAIADVINNINVEDDVERVVNRRVNSDLTKPLNTLISENSIISTETGKKYYPIIQKRVNEFVSVDNSMTQIGAVYGKYGYRIQQGTNVLSKVDLDTGGVVASTLYGGNVGYTVVYADEKYVYYQDSHLNFYVRNKDTLAFISNSPVGGDYLLATDATNIYSITSGTSSRPAVFYTTNKTTLAKASVTLANVMSTGGRPHIHNDGGYSYFGAGDNNDNIYIAKINLSSGTYTTSLKGYGKYRINIRWIDSKYIYAETEIGNISGNFTLIPKILGSGSSSEATTYGAIGSTSFFSNLGKLYVYVRGGSKEDGFYYCRTSDPTDWVYLGDQLVGWNPSFITGYKDYIFTNSSYHSQHPKNVLGGKFLMNSYNIAGYEEV